MGAQARTLWLPAICRGIYFALRARGAAPDAAAIRPPSKQVQQRSCHLDAAAASPTRGGRNRSPRAAAALPHNKHGVHAHAPHTATSLRDALTVPATAGHPNEEAQRALPPNQNDLAAAVARRTSKKKGPAHVPHARDWLRA